MITTLITFLIVLAILVLSHEFGHFIVARKSGIRVDEFGFGFPPRVCGVQRLVKMVGAKKEIKWRFVWGKVVPPVPAEWSGGTVYSLNLLPLGGFVKIKGEDASGTEAADPDSFAAKKTWQKSLVLLAGVFMNDLVAIVLFSAGFMIGLPQPTENMADVRFVRDRKIEIMQVLPGKPAEKAGLKAGDVLVSVGPLQNPRLKELQQYIDANRDGYITVVVERDRARLTQSIHPVVNADNGKGGIGVAIAEIGFVRYPWYRALYEGVITTFVDLKEIVLGFYHLLIGLFTGAGVGGAVSGPVGVAMLTGRVARMGFSYLVQFTALLSLNLAVLNVLPIPALDGGRLAFVLIAKILRRPITPKYEQIAHLVGFGALMLLVLFVTFKDLANMHGIVGNFFSKFF